MPTLFDEVYDMFFKICDDFDIKKKYKLDYAYKVLNDYLNYSISLFGDYCYKNLYNTTPFQRETYTFKGDGITKNFTLTSTPPNGCFFYVDISDIENKDFTYNSNTNTVSFTAAPEPNSDIYISAYIIGEFSEKLNIQEITILAEGMILPFQSEKLNQTRLLNQIVYGKDYQAHSQGNHIKEVRETKKMQKEDVLQAIMMYSYKQNPNKLNDLHG